MSSDEQQIRELIATWMSATRAGDIATVLSLMTDDVVFLVAGQPPFGKQKFAEAMRPAPGAAMPRIDGHSEIEEIRIAGDWAFVRTRLSVEITPPGAPPMKRAGHTLSVLRRTDGRWRLARDANLLTPVAL
ncbi:MAG TPA: SgcJ/EcaC family oxidoreductase [Steroidobacteraceae bacterium]|nr:SgcJ/EcaC family oxidoreductase [Steroidobacteraceae bacterium]